MCKKYKKFSLSFGILLMLFGSTLLNAQNRELVWSDEFNENSINNSNWEFDTGPSNDNVHYYTSRDENIQIVDSILNIIALEESYMGFNYTSGLIKTKINWKYGRMEARIKLPATKGFVPAFWMLPADNIYGWWPKSGEIDIMEHPTNEVSNIYGSIHTETYNNFSGVGNEGDVTVIADAETEFHIYAVEWNEDQIDFYVDNNLYYTFNNSHNGSATWPFDKPFYIILNLAVGGGWVGDPDETTVFPAIMQVDWVRVYQYFDDIAIEGADFLPYSSSDIIYSIPNITGAQYSWDVPGNAEITSDQNTNQINVGWNYFSGDINATITTDAGSHLIKYPVKVSANLLKNSGYEKGVKYWNGTVGYPAVADFSLTTSEIFYGNQALAIDVQTLGTNPWDIQISQKELTLNAGQQYKLSFWAKSDNANGEINLAIINSSFFVYHGETFEITNDWAQYEITYTATTSDIVGINIDLGIQTGVYYFDQFLFTTPELSNVNQIRNADFFDNNTSWNFVTHGTAQAIDSVINGEIMISIANGGDNPWDIHLGQPGIDLENGKEYDVSFDAYALSPRTISVLLGKDSDPWTVYSGDQLFSLLTEKQSYKFSFIMNNPRDNQSRFGFDIGGISDDVFFDNIMVSSGAIPVSIATRPSLPKTIQLFQNYPNPFNPGTTISFALGKSSFVSLEIYNSLGERIKGLIQKKFSNGYHSINWDGKDNFGNDLPSGIYLYRIKANYFSQTRKMLLLR